MAQTYAIIFDCEFLTTEDAPQRFWNGPFDPDPIVVQIGAIRLDLTDNFALSERLRLHVRPRDREGRPVALDPFFSRLTGITQARIETDGLDLEEALDRLSVFAGHARLWSWGKDELNMMGISCYVAGISAPIPPARFGNACALLLKAGMDYEDVKTTRSHTLPAKFGIESVDLSAHDALDDAISVALTLQHLLRAGRLQPSDCA